MFVRYRKYKEEAALKRSAHGRGPVVNETRRFECFMRKNHFTEVDRLDALEDFMQTLYINLHATILYRYLVKTNH